MHGHLLCRQPSGFVGLKNAGATCYMNAVFQQLFMQPSIRALVLGAREEAPAERIDSTFYQLQASGPLYFWLSGLQPLLLYCTIFLALPVEISRTRRKLLRTTHAGKKGLIVYSWLLCTSLKPVNQKTYCSAAFC